MFAYFYQFCVVVFLLQGVATPFLLLGLGLVWRRQSRRLEALRRELESARGPDVKAERLFELALKRLPKLRPLKCANCAGGVLLREGETLCAYCGARGELPADYGAARSLKSQLRSLLRSAVRHWRVANVLTHPAARWGFFLLIFAEPLVLFPSVLVGSNLYPDAWVDRAFAALGETAGFVVMLAAFLGFIVWMVVFIMLSNLSRTLRAKLPAAPAFGGETRGREAAACQTCGGAVEYDANAFACLCDYCHVTNYRARFARRERARGERQAAETKSALFGAMDIIEDFVGSAFFLLLILAGAAVLLSLFYAVKNLL